MSRIVVLMTVLAIAGDAYGQSINAQAQALFKQGKSLMTEKKFAEACDAFNASYKISPTVATLLNHADCREKNGQLVTAWGLFNDVERETRSADDAASKSMNATASMRAKKLEPRLSKLTVRVAATPGLELARNGERIDANTWNLTLPIDGGTYTFVARAPQMKEWTTSITVAPEGEAKVVDVPALEPVKVDVVVAPSPTPAPVAPIHQETRGKRSLLMPIVFGGAAVVLGGTAYGFSRWGDSIYADAEREPDDARQEALWKSANKRRYAAEGLAIGAIGCVAAAVVFYVRGGSSDSEPKVTARSVNVSPVATGDAVGLSIFGAW